MLGIIIIRWFRQAQPANNNMQKRRMRNLKLYQLDRVVDIRKVIEENHQDTTKEMSPNIVKYRGWVFLGER